MLHRSTADPIDLGGRVAQRGGRGGTRGVRMRSPAEWISTNLGENSFLKKFFRSHVDLWRTVE
jgi:hypothetical protein